MISQVIGTAQIVSVKLLSEDKFSDAIKYGIGHIFVFT